jgi:hypothetical protein
LPAAFREFLSVQHASLSLSVQRRTTGARRAQRPHFFIDQ